MWPWRGKKNYNVTRRLEWIFWWYHLFCPQAIVHCAIVISAVAIHTAVQIVFSAILIVGIWCAVAAWQEELQLAK